MQIKQELLEKYNKPVPRYTSYPPANFFSEDFNDSNYIGAVEKSNDWEPQNISFYIHIPFCKKMCFYCGCNSCPIGKGDQVKKYTDALKKEISLVLPLIHKNRKISQIHYGGGTPNAIAAEYLSEINQLLLQNFDLTENPEIAIECHPAYLNEAYIGKLIEAGFNRYSLGIQDFNPKVLKHINREPSKLELSELVSLIKQPDNNNRVNFDFIYGLPGQSKESFLETIDEAIRLQPDRLVTFSYAHVPWVNKNQKILEKKGLPVLEEKLDMYLSANKRLQDNGYRFIGMDHYVKDNDELYRALKIGKLHRNFQGYCTRETTGQVYAFGVSAISQLKLAYSQNTKNIEEYILSLSQNKLPVIKGYALNENEYLIREVITQLMCNKKVDWDNLSGQLGVSREKLFASIDFSPAVLEPFNDDKIIRLSDNGFEITETGVLFLRNVAAGLDPLISQSEGRFSKAV